MPQQPQHWSDLYSFFSAAFRYDPVSRKRARKGEGGVGVTQPDVPDIRAADNWWSNNKGQIRLRDSNDFIDLSSVTNRKNRYKEYERLRSVAEIEAALNILADESCVVGSTPVETPFGPIPIRKLAETKAPDDKFLVYCWSFEAQDYTLGWAHSPRKVKTAPTIEIMLDNGETVRLTEDHRILKRDGEWIHAGEVKTHEELMPFYRISPAFNESKTNQFPRIYTFAHGWKHERALIDEWRLGKDYEPDPRFKTIMKHLTDGLSVRQTMKVMDLCADKIIRLLRKNGFSSNEIKHLNLRYPNRRRVIGVKSGKVEDVYDLSVDVHENFASKSLILHNCQKGDNNHTFEIVCKNEMIKKELEHLFHRQIRVDSKIWNWAKNLYCMGDWFGEVIVDAENPRWGVIDVRPLPTDSMYRIETTKGKLLEFQQSNEGPDYHSLARIDITQATDAEIAQTTAIRFAPEQIVHMRIGDDRKTFYPYGVSIIEPARGPAHSLRLMEDAMLVYRLSRSPERRVYYIDVGSLPPNKAEAFVDRLKDQLRKKKMYSNRSGQPGGAGSIEERFHIPSMDEDIWLPVRPQGNTRIETLPGACLALDTKIPLLDGRELTLQEIIGEFREGKTLWAYSCNPENGEPAPGKITWAGVTRKQTQVVRVHFDNGESIVCTPDHKFPVIGKGRVEAQNLQIGESMIPWSVRDELLPPKFKYEYKSIYNNSTKDWQFVHRMVAEYTRGTSHGYEHVFNEDYKNHDKNVVHHMDYNRFNNNPNNLFWMNWDDHTELHKFKPKFVCEKISSSVRKFHEQISSDDPFYDRLKAMSHIAAEKHFTKLREDAEYREFYCRRQKEGWKAKKEDTEFVERISQRSTDRNNAFWSNPENKEKVFKKQTVVYPQEIFDEFMRLFGEGKLQEDALTEINSNEKLMKIFVEANAHIVRDIDLTKGMSDWHVKKMMKTYGFKGVRGARAKALINAGVKTEVKQNISGLQYPKPLMDEFMKHLALGESVKTALIKINDSELVNLFASHNANVKRKTSLNKFTVGHALRMVRSYGYLGLSHAREEAKFYNHKVVKIEWLDEKIDTGTLTIDGNHELHDYHTFAVSPCGIYTCNSNLGETDDAAWFRSKLLIALHMPKGYMSGEDATVTTKTLSSQHVPFARYVERLQMGLASGLVTIGERHLTLKGYPEEMWDDFDILMTPPSAWREASLMDIIQARFGNAQTAVQAGFMSKYDALVEVLKYAPDVAREMASRAKMQAIEDMKIQVAGQNPDLLGVGQGGQEDQEMGGEAGGPNPMLGGGEPPGGQPPGGQSTPPSGGDFKNEPAQQPDLSGPAGSQPQAEAKPLPEPDEADIRKYDLAIRNWSLGQDEEEVDRAEIL